MASTSTLHPDGKAIKVLNFDENNKVVIDYEELNQLFSHPEIKDRKVAVFSTIGAFRKGKSFFLNYALRFLYANVSKKSLFNQKK